jgi:hypothetical protein
MSALLRTSEQYYDGDDAEELLRHHDSRKREDVHLAVTDCKDAMFANASHQQCHGLKLDQTSHTARKCAETCCSDSQCAVWQFGSDQDGATSACCWQGRCSSSLFSQTGFIGGTRATRILGTDDWAAPVPPVHLDEDGARRWHQSLDESLEDWSWDDCDEDIQGNRTDRLFRQLILVTEALAATNVEHLIIYGTLIGALRDRALNPHEVGEL